MSDDYKMQASIKFGPGQIGMLNIRANTADELRDSTGAAVGVCGELAVLVEALNTEFAAVSAVASAFPGTTVDRGPSQGQQQTGAPTCPHGPMQYRESPDGGNSWKGHFCSLPKGDPAKCKPRYIR